MTPTITLRKEPFEAPGDIALPGGGTIHPFLGGSTLPWKPVESTAP